MLTWNCFWHFLTFILLALGFISPTSWFLFWISKTVCKFNLLKNFHVSKEIDCPPTKAVPSNVSLCPTYNKLGPWRPKKEKFWRCSKLKSALVYWWMGNWNDGSTDGNQLNVFNTDSSFERLHVRNEQKPSDYTCASKCYITGFCGLLRIR